MSGIYGEPAEVRARDDGRPLRFVWRSRLYVVHAILEHWVINQEWWRDPAAERGQPELEFWRVEASPGRGVPAQVYELRRDPVADTWMICPHLAGTQGRRHLSPSSLRRLAAEPGTPRDALPLRLPEPVP